MVDEAAVMAWRVAMAAGAVVDDVRPLVRLPMLLQLAGDRLERAATL
jgi:hypothetical protein